MEVEAEVEAVLAVALSLAVTTWALAVLAVTTSAVLDVLALKPLGYLGDDTLDVSYVVRCFLCCEVILMLWDANAL